MEGAGRPKILVLHLCCCVAAAKSLSFSGPGSPLPLGRRPQRGLPEREARDTEGRDGHVLPGVAGAGAETEVRERPFPPGWGAPGVPTEACPPPSSLRPHPYTSPVRTPRPAPAARPGALHDRRLLPTCHLLWPLPHPAHPCGHCSGPCHIPAHHPWGHCASSQQETWLRNLLQAPPKVADHLGEAAPARGSREQGAELLGVKAFPPRAGLDQGRGHGQGDGPGAPAAHLQACCREARTGPSASACDPKCPHCALGPGPVLGTPCLLPKEPTRWGSRWSQGRGPGYSGHLCAPFSVP